MRVLLVEDDELLGDGIQAGLAQYRYTVDWAKDGQKALHAILNESFEAIILDLGLPKYSGLEVLKTIRAKHINVPVIILTARDSIEDRIKGLDSGADDYLTKPFNLEELCARLRAIQRRGSSGRTETVITYGDISLDPVAYKVYKAEQPIDVSRREFALLHMLLSHIGQVITRERLTQNLYGWREDIDSNAIEVHIHNLRKKLGENLIHTIRGVGYIVEKDTK
jgi:two-component system, OmpR family, response regulator QseB